MRKSSSTMATLIVLLCCLVSSMTLKRLVERYAEFDQTVFIAFNHFDCVLEDTASIKAMIGKPT